LGTFRTTLTCGEPVLSVWLWYPAAATGPAAEYAPGVWQGLRKFGILYPNDQYGIPLSQAFRRQVEQRGGQVVGSVTYEPSQKEFSVELLSADKWIKGDSLQAMFIPDFAQTAIPLATQLRQAHPDVILLGSNGWNDPSKLGPAADRLEGAVFVDGFFASSQRRGTQEFVAAYRSAYGGTPEILEAPALKPDTALARRPTLDEVERRYIVATLQFARGNQTDAAKILGISRKALWEKRKRYGLD